MHRKFGRNDVILIACLFLLCLVAYGGMRMFGTKKGNEVTITRDGQEYGTYALNKDQTIEITDEDGKVTNTLVIADGKADMKDADCPDRLCVKQKAISRQNENIVCLPNKIVVTVTESDAKGVDGFVQ